MITKNKWFEINWQWEKSNGVLMLDLIPVGLSIMSNMHQSFVYVYLLFWVLSFKTKQK